MKTFLPPAIRIAGLGLLILAHGCDSAPGRHPRSTQSVVLSARRAAPDVEMEIVSSVEVVLPPGPPGSEGYSWEIASNNSKVLEQMGPLKRADSADASAPATTSVSFYALKPGKSVLRFVLVRPGEAEAVPAATCEVTVRVSD